MIECRGVSFSYDGAVPALDGVDLNIEDGEFFCILGGNGSGKSTFAKHLNALLQPDAGTVRINGMDASDPELVYDIRSTAGMVFQNPDDQLVATLVEDDVAFGPENLGVPSAQIAQRVREALKGVGLVGFERHETHALSGGQKQRVALAGVLAMEPRVLILDEASSMLDPRGRKGLMKACRALHARGMTIVMITHFMEEAAEADRVAVFQTGRVAMLGTPDEILTRANELVQLNLDMPESCRLGMALRAEGVPVCAQVREADMVAEIAQAYAERSGAGIAGQSSVSQSEIADGTVPVDNEGNASEPVIELSHVSYSYSLSPRERRRWHKRSATAGKSSKQALWGNDPSSPWALRDVSLTVRRGEFLGLAGHTGSGKSTTLYATLGDVAKPEINIITVEDPVEFRMRGINQVQVNNKAGMTFAAALRSILRADPDVVLIGEIRDQETANIAIEASLTGHLVLSTLHTNDAPSAVTRLTEMGVEPFLLSSSLAAVMAQRLARRLCKKCKRQDTATEAELRTLGVPHMPDTPLPTIWRPVGCRECANTGYSGRVAIQQVMGVDSTMEDLIARGATSIDIDKAAKEQGMTTLRKDGWQKALQGITSVEEVLRVTV